MAELESILKTTENNITPPSQHSQPLKDLMNVDMIKNLPTITTRVMKIRKPLMIIFE
jgi:hypothetical protein